LYARYLSDLPQSRLRAAFGRCLRDLKFFPKIGEIREFAEAYEEQPQSTYIDPRGPRCTLCDGSKWRLVGIGKVVRCHCPAEAIKTPEIGAVQRGS
jgi:hypothetical protein